MRAIVDSNIYISHLLNDSGTGSVGQVIGLAAQGRIRLTMPPEQIAEMRHVVTTKPFLRQRISLETLETFFVLLESIGEVLPLVIGDPPRVLRDRKDDFLIESARQNNVGLIVSGDKDLLAWHNVTMRVVVVSPADLERHLDSQSQDYP